MRRFTAAIQRAPMLTRHSWMQRRALFIRTEDTPNEHAMRFMAGRLLAAHPTEFRGRTDMHVLEDAASRSLVADLLAIDGVAGLLFTGDSVTVTKNTSVAWPLLKPAVYAALADHVGSAPQADTHPLLRVRSTDAKELPPSDSISSAIVEVIEQRVRPAVQADGGDVQFVSFDAPTGTVILSMHGACRTCASSEATLKHGIEAMLRHYVPEVSQVIQKQDSDGAY